MDNVLFIKSSTLNILSNFKGFFTEINNTIPIFFYMDEQPNEIFSKNLLKRNNNYFISLKKDGFSVVNSEDISLCNFEINDAEVLNLFLFVFKEKFSNQYTLHKTPLLNASFTPKNNADIKEFFYFTENFFLDSNFSVTLIDEKVFINHDFNISSVIYSLHTKCNIKKVFSLSFDPNGELHLKCSHNQLPIINNDDLFISNNLNYILFFKKILSKQNFFK